jgi:streptogramin lyase
LEQLESRRLLTAIFEFPTTTAASAPYGIAAGSDGNLWFTEQAARQIGFINPTTGAINEFSGLQPTSEPFGITAGPNGNLWFTDPGANLVGTINPSTGAIKEFTIPSNASAPYGIAAGSDGNLWFTAFDTNQAGTINPTTQITAAYATNTLPSGPEGIAAGPDGNLWFTENIADQIGMINPTTHTITEFTGLSANAGPAGITLGPDGNLWFTENAIGRIGMINPTTGLVQEVADLAANAQPTGITLGPDGNLWFTEPPLGRIGMINPTTKAVVEFADNYRNAQPEGIAAGPDGNIWFTDMNTSSVGVAVLDTQLVIRTQPPATVTAGSPFGFSVAVQYAGSGTLDTGYSGSVSVALFNNPGGGTLSGPVTVPVIGGIATFNGLSLMRAASGYTLLVFGNGPTPALSNPINVIPAVATQLKVTTQPPAHVTAGSPFGLVVAAEDRFGNVNPDFTGVVTVALATGPGSGSLGGTLSEPSINGVATFLGLTLDQSIDHVFLQVTTSGLAPANTALMSVTAAPATQLEVTTEPEAAIAAGSPFTITVAAEDRFGNVDLSFGGDVTVALAHNPGGGALAGTLTLPAGMGVATFTDLALEAIGNGYTLRATANGLTTASTQSFDITPAAAAQLVVTTEPPSSVSAGSGFGLVVAAEDPFGNVDPSFTGVVTLVLASGPAGAALSGGARSVAAVAGVATFSGLTLDEAGSGYMIRATHGGLSATTTTSFVVLPSAATQLVVTSQPPGSVVAGGGFGLVITAQDSFGNTSPAFVGTVVLALESNPPGGTLGGTPSVPATLGAATFAGLYLDRAAVGYSLRASAAGVASAISRSFNVVPAQATQLVVTTQPPPTVTAGSAFGLAASAEDPFGNVDPSYGGTVTVALAADPTGDSLLGRVLTVSASQGVASFSGLALRRAAIGYTLQVTAGGLSPATTSTVEVTPSAAAQLVITSQPPATITAGSAFGLVVAADDSYGNLNTAFTGSVTIALANNPGGGPLNGILTVTAQGGVATFTGLTLQKAAAGYVFRSTSNGPAATTSNACAVVPGAATQLVVLSQPPGTITAGSDFGLVVSVEDAFGNSTPSFSGTVTVALGSNPGGGGLGGTRTVTPSQGLATFAGLTLNKAAVGYTLIVSSGGLTSATTETINVLSAAATQLVITAEPPRIVIAGAMFGLSIVAEDALGNIDTGFNAPITVALVNNPGDSQLQGAVTATALHGMATFAGLSLNAAATGYTLEVSGSGLSSAPPVMITVLPAAATHLFVTTQPPNSVAPGSRFNVAIAAEDAFGNIDSSFNGSVMLALASNPVGAVLGGAVAVAAAGGLASVTGLTVNRGGVGYTLLAKSTGLAAALTSPFQVTAPPTIIGAHVLTAGRGRRRSTIGFQLVFSAALEPTTAQNVANYTVIQNVKRGRKTIRQHVGFNVVYNPSTYTVNLILAGKPGFAAGGQMIVNASPPIGITDSSGTYLDGSGDGVTGKNATFTISPKARGITR